MLSKSVRIPNTLSKLFSLKNDEINQLKSSVKELRNQMEKLRFEKREAIQNQIQASANEIKQLKLSCSALREELENLKFEKQEAIQNAIKKSSLEINELKYEKIKSDEISNSTSVSLFSDDSYKFVTDEFFTYKKLEQIFKNLKICLLITLAIDNTRMFFNKTSL